MIFGPVGITGASGLVGRHLTRKLDLLGVPYVSVSRNPISPLGKGSKWRCWDVSYWKTNDELDRIFQDVTSIIHLAAKISVDVDGSLIDVNVRSCINIANWALEKKIPLIFVSSSSVYSDPWEHKISENSEIGNTVIGGFYSVTKVMAESSLSYFLIEV